MSQTTRKQRAMVKAGTTGNWKNRQAQREQNRLDVLRAIHHGGPKPEVDMQAVRGRVAGRKVETIRRRGKTLTEAILRLFGRRPIMPINNPKVEAKEQAEKEAAEKVESAAPEVAATVPA